MSKPSLEQGFQGLLSLAVNVNWEEVDSVLFQKTVVQDPVRAGLALTAFLRNGARLMFGILVTIVSRAKKFNPVTFIGKDWKVLEGDARSLSLTEIDWSKVTFETSLREGETSITGEEKLRRLTESGVMRLDAQVGEALLLDYKANGESSVLERLRRERGINYLDFFGTILGGPDGSRRVLCLRWDGGEWYWRVDWLEDVWRSGLVSPVLAGTSN